MVALAITVGQVALISGAPKAVIAGEAFTVGSAIYLKSTDRKYWKAQCDGTVDEAGAQDLAIALASADAAGAMLQAAGDGCIVDLGAGAAAAAGTFYHVGAAAGAIVPTADLATTNKVALLGVGVGTNRILVQRVYNAGAVKP